MLLLCVVLLPFLYFGLRVKIKASITRGSPGDSGATKKSQLVVIQHGQLQSFSQSGITLSARVPAPDATIPSTGAKHRP
ncbi:hypothetical protein NpPPO83_00007353 [Neofusicoccum parvum]|uniref:Uncharacterized protein n=1 Tax=Neofusicoccum parvum TaxID=310453 RepID=A0ACB5S3T7_9PEZI|nr:hypothetical protein NpPPO83_00007353 [Neofusicoccum parvum]